VKQSAKDKRYSTGAANVLTTLNAIPGIMFTNEDFSGVNIKGANLIGFQGENVNFSGATLEDIQIANADLQGAKFIETSFNNINFSQYPVFFLITVF